MITDFSQTYALVRPTVLRLMTLYHIKLWEKSDWDQEGMLVLHQLLSRHPELLADKQQVRVYFKTKFTNYLNDIIRKQESQKRRFNKLAHEDISEVAHLVPSREMLLDDYVVFKDCLERAKQALTSQEQEQIDQLLTGRAFKGRTQLIRKLRVLLAD